VGDVELRSAGQGVAEIVLNRPERRNAVTTAAAGELAEAVRAAGADESVSAVLLRGAGDCLCSGIDLAELPPSAEFFQNWQAVHAALAELDVPLVVALQRAAVNAGASLALAADLLVAGEESVLRIGEVARGMVPWANVSWLVARHGVARTLDLTLTARPVSGAELFRLGLAHQVVPDDEVLAVAREVAGALTANSRDAMIATKRLVRKVAQAPGGPVELT
jgi:enoyl-CoA hydratase/carnithine racemase